MYNHIVNDYGNDCFNDWCNGYRVRVLPSVD